MNAGWIYPFIVLGGHCRRVAPLYHYGWLHMPMHAINQWRVSGAVLMIGGIALIARH